MLNKVIGDILSEHGEQIYLQENTKYNYTLFDTIRNLWINFIQEKTPDINELKQLYPSLHVNIEKTKYNAITHCLFIARSYKETNCGERPKGWFRIHLNNDNPIEPFLYFSIRVEHDDYGETVGKRLKHRVNLWKPIDEITKTFEPTLEEFIITLFDIKKIKV